MIRLPLITALLLWSSSAQALAPASVWTEREWDGTARPNVIEFITEDPRAYCKAPVRRVRACTWFDYRLGYWIVVYQAYPGEYDRDIFPAGIRVPPNICAHESGHHSGWTGEIVWNDHPGAAFMTKRQRQRFCATYKTRFESTWSSTCWRYPHPGGDGVLPATRRMAKERAEARALKWMRELYPDRRTGYYIAPLH